MKKIFAFAALAMMLVAGSAFAQVSLDPAIVNANNATCDIAVAPAATLLLPYFEVGLGADPTTAQNTIFSLINTSDEPVIAHITVWSNWSVPVLDFNIFLTGYDVQGLSLYDIITRGQIPPTGWPSASGFGARSITTRPARFDPLAPSLCASLPGPIPASILAQVQSALTGGSYFTCAQVGDDSVNAIGYVTVDTANTCTLNLPTEPTYWATEVLYDNVLTGDWQIINPTATTGNYAGGSPLVHIRAVPEGTDTAISAQPTPFPTTFYARYSGGTDRRQPLPALFAARYIDGGAGNFNTRFLVWREGPVVTACGTANSSFAFTELVRFDERENPTTNVSICPVSPCFEEEFGLPETSAVSMAHPAIPADTNNADLGGWIYFNLNDPNNTGAAAGAIATQNWVVVDMTAEGRYGVDFDATFLANGCTPEMGVTSSGRTGLKIMPESFRDAYLPTTGLR